MIPFGILDLPLWLVNSGCLISSPRTIQKYLGAPWGTGLDDAQLMDFCLERISSRFWVWSSRFLSFTGRTLLIRHVLQAIPIYQMMFIHLPKVACLQMIRLFRNFLWGFNKEGGRKIALVAWAKLCQSKELGGLGFKDILDHATTLLSKWAARLLDRPDSEWAKMYKVNLELARWKSGHILRRNLYTFEDRILFGTISDFGAMKYSTGLWGA